MEQRGDMKLSGGAKCEKVGILAFCFLLQIYKQTHTH